MNAHAKVAIVGGGPSGLMMARQLAADGHDVDLFEGEAEIGGLCRSRTVDGYVFDLAGGHIMYTRDDRVRAFWEELFVDEPLVSTERNSRILHDNDVWVTYPFENGIGELPLEAKLACAEGLIRSHLAREGSPAPDDFASWIQWKMGDGIARHFMEPYNRKIWKEDLARMSSCWVEGRVPDAPIDDVLRSFLGESTLGYAHQATFTYPRTGGFASIHERIAAPIVDRVHLNHRVQLLEPVRGGEEGWKVDGVLYDHVICTAPLHLVPDLVPSMHADVAAAARGLQFRGVASYLLGIPEDQVEPLCWVYLPHERQGPANRITYLSNYSPENAPTGKGSILAEVTYRPDAPPDVTSAGRRDLARALEGAGLIDASSVDVDDAALNPIAYILYDLDFEAKRTATLEYLDALPGFHALGRFGRYNYHNSDHCLADAMDLHTRLAPVLARGGGPLAARPDPADGDGS